MYIKEAPEKVKGKGLEGGFFAGRDWRTKSHNVAYWAAKFGRLEILDWLNDQADVNLMPTRLHDKNSMGKRNPFDGVADGGQIESFHWFLRHGFDMKGNEFSMLGHAASNGQVDFLKYFHEKGYGVGGSFMCGYAARGGHLNVVKSLHQINPGGWDNSTCSSAAKCGSLEILQHAHENGCNWTHKRNDPVRRKVDCCAASGGHLQCLRYFYQHGGEVEPAAVTLAAEGGHLETLAFLFRKGVQPSKNLLVSALEISAKKGNKQGLKVFQGKIDRGLFHQVIRAIKHRAGSRTRPEAMPPHLRGLSAEERLHVARWKFLVSQGLPPPVANMMMADEGKLSQKRMPLVFHTPTHPTSALTESGLMKVFEMRICLEPDKDGDRVFPPAIAVTSIQGKLLDPNLIPIVFQGYVPDPCDVHVTEAEKKWFIDTEEHSARECTLLTWLV